MKTVFKLPVSFLMLAAPLAAHAEIFPSTGVDALVGGAVGGFIGGVAGALLAFLVTRGSKDNDNSKS